MGFVWGCMYFMLFYSYCVMFGFGIGLEFGENGDLGGDFDKCIVILYFWRM